MKSSDIKYLVHVMMLGKILDKILPHALPKKMYTWAKKYIYGKTENTSIHLYIYLIISINPSINQSLSLYLSPCLYEYIYRFQFDLM